jgi:hypothetical protein
VTDWLSRRRGGVIDFRLPGDPLDIPSELMKQREREYLAQLRNAEKPAENECDNPTNSKGCETLQTPNNNTSRQGSLL